MDLSINYPMAFELLLPVYLTRLRRTIVPASTTAKYNINNSTTI